MNEKIIGQHLTNYSRLPVLDNQGCHGLALQVLESYFHLGKDFAECTVCLVHDSILYLRKRKRAFVYSYTHDDLDIIKALQEQAMIYSTVEIEQLDNRSNFYEIVYDLDEVFDRSSYPNKKKRYNRLTAPFKWIEKNKIKVATPTLSEVEVLHKAWVDFKLKQPGTYRIMFPTARYLNCFKEADQNRKDYRIYGFYLAEELVSLRVLGVNVDKHIVYDLANFTNIWSTPSQVANYFDVYVLKDLHESGFKIFNCGASLNKNLKAFKCHYPYRKLKVYSYGRLKKERKSESLNPIF